MRKLILIIIVLLIGAIIIPLQASITDVTIQPETPITTDLISILVSGEESSGPVQITDSVYDLDSFDITLDLTLEAGLSPVITPWDYTYDVGLLSEGIYGLTVNTLVPSMPSRNDTYITSFEVVPEPATVLFFGLGMFLLRGKKD